MSFLCRIGFHKWNRPTYTDLGPSSHIRDWKKTCLRCGKRKSWVEGKKS